MSTPLVFAFDFDGVIVDSAPAYVRAINTVGQRHGAKHSLDLAQLSRMPEYFHRRSAQLIGLPEEALESYSAGLRQEFHQTSTRAELHKDIAPLLTELQQRGSVMVVSANDSDVIGAALEQLEVSVQGVYAGCGRDAKAQVLEQLALTARVVMIGDTLSDCHAASQAGVACVAVGWGWQCSELLASSGVPVVENRRALAKWLQLWAKAPD